MSKEKTNSNSKLHKANKAKNDEFYTQLVDIEKELKHYKEQFRGKIVYCNLMIHLKVIFQIFCFKF